MSKFNEYLEAVRKKDNHGNIDINEKELNALLKEFPFKQEGGEGYYDTWHWGTPDNGVEITGADKSQGDGGYIIGSGDKWNTVLKFLSIEN